MLNLCLSALGWMPVTQFWKTQIIQKTASDQQRDLIWKCVVPSIENKKTTQRSDIK